MAPKVINFDYKKSKRRKKELITSGKQHCLK